MLYVKRHNLTLINYSLMLHFTNNNRLILFVSLMTMNNLYLQREKKNFMNVP